MSEDNYKLGDIVQNGASGTGSVFKKTSSGYQCIITNNEGIFKKGEYLKDYGDGYLPFFEEVKLGPFLLKELKEGDIFTFDINCDPPYVYKVNNDKEFECIVAPNKGSTVNVGERFLIYDYRNGFVVLLPNYYVESLKKKEVSMNDYFKPVNTLISPIVYSFNYNKDRIISYREVYVTFSDSNYLEGVEFATGEFKRFSHSKISGLRSITFKTLDLTDIPQSLHEQLRIGYIKEGNTAIIYNNKLIFFKKERRFVALKVGETFIFGSDRYVKVTPININSVNLNYNAINLKTKVVTLFSDSEMVNLG